MKFVRYVFHGSSSPCPGGGKRRFAFGIWAVVLAVAVVVGGVVPTLAATSVKYLDASGTEQTKDSTTEIPGAASNKVALGNANNETWYSTSTTTTSITDPIEVTGTVHLILVDSTTLTAQGGITLADSATLNIYAQSNTGDTIGKLTVYKGIAGESANLTINGGVIAANGRDGQEPTEPETNSTAGAAGENGRDGVVGINVSTLTVNAGTVTATGEAGVQGGTGGAADSSNAGGAGGNGGNGADGIVAATAVNINGGSVTATGGAGGKGGTGGASSESGKAAGTGGNGGNGGNGITVSDSESITITNGALTATAGAVGAAGDKGTASNSATEGSDGNSGDNTSVYDINANIAIDFNTVDDSITIKAKDDAAPTMPTGKSVTATKALTCNSTTVEANGTVTLATGTNTITPQTWTVTFDWGYKANDSDENNVTQTQKVLKGEHATQPETPTRTGYTFEKWHKESATGNEYTFGNGQSTEIVTADTNIYASWTKNPVITLTNLNGATITDTDWIVDTDANTATQDFAPNTASITLPTLTEPTGYTFVGWTGKSLTGIETPYTVTTLTGDLTFTALWKRSGTFAATVSGNNPAIVFHSLMLGGRIGVMFYVYLPDSNPSEYTMKFKVNGQNPDGWTDAEVASGVSKTTEKLITTATGAEAEAEGEGVTEIYGFECPLTSIQLAEPITAELWKTSETEAATTEVFTAEVYLDALVGEGNGEATTGVPLGKAIKNYGHYAQAMLDEAHTTWEVGTDYTAIAPSAGDLTTIAATDMKGVNAGSCTIPDGSGIDTAENNGVQFSLNLDSATTINIYLKTKTGFTGSLEVTGVDSGPTKDESTPAEDTYNVGLDTTEASTTYVVKIADIPAHELAKEHTITVTTKASDTDAVSFNITLSPLSYARSVLASSADTTSDAEKKAATALYNYYKATMEYRATKGYNEAVDTAFTEANTTQSGNGGN